MAEKLPYCNYAGIPEALHAGDTVPLADEQVTYAKMQHVSATDKVLGRFNAGAGDVEEIACTSAGRALIDDATAAAQRTTLGIDTLLPPVGSIMMWCTASDPDGWLICNGDAVSRTTYAALFAVIGTTFGIGDGSTTFNLPDFRGVVPVGFKVTDTDFDAIGHTGGAKTHTLTTTEMPAHTHTISPIASGGGTDVRTADGTAAWTTQPTSSTGGGGAHNNLQPYLALCFIIKH